jgi:putative pyruvate formate lyase activating enzyme
MAEHHQFISALEKKKETVSLCSLCNLKCGIDRSSALGFCGIDDGLYIAHYGLHRGEEPFLTLGSGSGTIFFAGCSLRCVFCQNYQISRLTGCRSAPAGLVRSYSIGGLVSVFFELMDMGACNINLVSPTPYVPFIREAVTEAKRKAFPLPFVYNTHGNDSPETIESLADIIDIYLPDMKYGSDEAGLKFSGVDGLYSLGKKTIAAMYAQKGGLEFDANGMARRGVLVRHLVLPGQAENSMSVIDFLETLGRGIHLSLMSQFHPLADAPAGSINRRLSRAEYKRIADYALALGFENLLLQDMESGADELPDFTKENVFEY